MHAVSHRNCLWDISAGLPGSGGDSRAAAVEGDVRGVGGEARQDAVRISVGKSVDLHRVVGARRHQLAFLWRRGCITSLSHTPQVYRRVLLF